MACCGQKRAALAGRTQLKPAAAFTPPLAPKPNAAASVVLRYLGRTSLVLRGATTGSIYYVAQLGDQINIQAQDVDALLLTRLFARAEQ